MVGKVEAETKVVTQKTTPEERAMQRTSGIDD